MKITKSPAFVALLTALRAQGFGKCRVPTLKDSTGAQTKEAEYNADGSLTIRFPLMGASKSALVRATQAAGWQKQDKKNKFPRAEMHRVESQGELKIVKKATYYIEAAVNEVPEQRLRAWLCPQDGTIEFRWVSTVTKKFVPPVVEQPKRVKGQRELSPLVIELNRKYKEKVLRVGLMKGQTDDEARDSCVEVLAAELEANGFLGDCEATAERQVKTWGKLGSPPEKTEAEEAAASALHAHQEAAVKYEKGQMSTREFKAFKLLKECGLISHVSQTH